jgi:hypothetical protein
MLIIAAGILHMDHAVGESLHQTYVDPLGVRGLWGGLEILHKGFCGIFWEILGFLGYMHGSI